MQAALNNVAALWGLLLLIAVFGVLFWFVYRVFLRKILRIRRIAGIRSRRELLEASKRNSSADHSENIH